MKTTLMLATAFLLTAAAITQAEQAEIGKPFPSYTLQDQFGTNHTMATSTRWVIIASEKDVSGKVNTWLKTKEADYLAQHNAEYISDIEPMPGIITTLFAMPKMKKYPFRLLLATEKEFARTYPSQKGKIAIFVLDDTQSLADIRYVDSAEEVEQTLTSPTR